MSALPRVAIFWEWDNNGTQMDLKVPICVISCIREVDGKLQSYEVDFRNWKQTNQSTKFPRTVTRKISLQPASSSPPSPSSGSNLTVTWTWDDSDNDEHYSPQHTQELENAYGCQCVPTYTITCARKMDGKQQSYEVDFKSWQQTNKSTNYTRRVTRTLSVPAMSSHVSAHSLPSSPSSQRVMILWEWNNGGAQTVYSSQYTQQLETAFSQFLQDSKVPTCVISCIREVDGKLQSYEVDFRNWEQTNQSTKYKRSVKRTVSLQSASSSPSSGSGMTVTWMWVDSDEDDKVHYSPQHTQELENAYAVQRVPTCIIICARKMDGKQQKYEVDFKSWQQTNLSTKYVRRVERKLLLPPSSHISSSPSSPLSPQPSSPSSSGPEAIPYPDYWLSQQSCPSNHRVGLSPTTVQYKQVAARFLQELPNSKIHSIESIQHYNLFSLYDGIRQLWASNIGSDKLNDQILYHGTPTLDSVNSIIFHGFKHHYTRVHKHGIGVYFGTKVSVAHTYTKENGPSKHRFIVVGRVVVGRSVENSDSNAKGIPIPGSKTSELYESFVDSKTNTEIVVVLHSYQAYPEFLVTYSR
eukprot:g38767.t1